MTRNTTGTDHDTDDTSIEISDSVKKQAERTGADPKRLQAAVDGFEIPDREDDIDTNNSELMVCELIRRLPERSPAVLAVPLGHPCAREASDEKKTTITRNDWPYEEVDQYLREQCVWCGEYFGLEHHDLTAPVMEADGTQHDGLPPVHPGQTIMHVDCYNEWIEDKNQQGDTP